MTAERAHVCVSLAILAALLCAPRASAIGNNKGKWGQVYKLPLVPVAGAVLPNNHLVLWSAYYVDSFGGGGGRTQTVVMDLATMKPLAQTVSNTDHDMFCSGTSLTADGRLLVSGGADAPATSIYNTATKTWIKGSPMVQPRGYNANTLLSDGRVFTLGGSWSGGTGLKNGEVWSPATGKWQPLPGVKVQPIYTEDPQGQYRADNHGWYFALGGGKVFHAGPSKNMHFIDTIGAGSITFARTRGNDADAMNGNAIMIAPGRILTVGGSTAYVNVKARASTHLITLSGTTVKSVETLAPMHHARAVCNAVVLPNGEVVVFGGQSPTEIFTDSNSVLIPEIWNPGTRTWRELAPMQVPRNYHSIALLLPNGKVLVGGGGLCNKSSCPPGTKNHLDYQVFTPPYLLKADGVTLAPRPAILKYPTVISPASQITVTTGGPVSAFSIVRLGAVTHSVNNDQRRVPLVLTPAGKNTYKLSIPAVASGTLPGYWLLFATSSDGVPSFGKFVRITVSEKAAVSTQDLPVFPSPSPTNLSAIPAGISVEEFQKD